MELTDKAKAKALSPVSEDLKFSCRVRVLEKKEGIEKERMEE